MTVVQINATCGKGSTGKICVALSRLMTENDIDNYILYSSGESGLANTVSCASRMYTRIQSVKSRVLGNYGFNSTTQTKRMISVLDKTRPDIVHLHNIHGHDCNLKLLFNYFKQNRIKIYWTFHDCWAFTGYCPYYDMIGCDKWKTKCRKCPQRKCYSLLFDRSTKLHELKKELFSGLDMTIITPSQWLADQVKESFLKDYPVKVINNGIDLNVFKYTSGNDKKYDYIKEKKVVLGVAFDWNIRKGIDVFERMSHDLDDSYQIIMVGVDKQTQKRLPSNVVCINRTANQEELAELYSISDVFVNPTREENFPTTHMEALACGTPVISFNTGGSGEMLTDKTGITVKKNDYSSLIEAIRYVCEKKPFSRDDCRKQAECYDQNICFLNYLNLYREER